MIYRSCRLYASSHMHVCVVTFLGRLTKTNGLLLDIVIDRTAIQIVIAKDVRAGYTIFFVNVNTCLFSIVL